MNSDDLKKLSHIAIENITDAFMIYRDIHKISEIVKEYMDENGESSIGHDDTGKVLACASSIRETISKIYANIITEADMLVDALTDKTEEENIEVTSDNFYKIEDVSSFSNKQLVDYLYTIIKQKYQIRIVFIAPNSIDEECYQVGNRYSIASFEPCSEDPLITDLMREELIIYQHGQGRGHSEVKECHFNISHIPGSFMFSMSSENVIDGVLCYAAVPIELADSLFDLIQCEYVEDTIIIEGRVYKKIKPGRDVSGGIYVRNILEKLIEISPFVLGHIDWKKLRFVGPRWVDPNQNQSNEDEDVNESIVEEIKEKFDPFICFYATTNETGLNDTLCCIMDKCEIIDPNPRNQNSSKELSMVAFSVQDPEEDLWYKVNFITHTSLASLCSVPRCGVSIMAVPVINVVDVDEFSKLYDYPNPRFLCARGRFNTIPLADNSCSLHVMIGEPVKLVCGVIDKTNMLTDNPYVDIMEQALKDIKRKGEN